MHTSKMQAIAIKMPTKIAIHTIATEQAYTFTTNPNTKATQQKRIQPPPGPLTMQQMKKVSSIIA